jgi:hypothetical protein
MIINSFAETGVKLFIGHVAALNVCPWSQPSRAPGVPENHMTVRFGLTLVAVNNIEALVFGFLHSNR